MAGRNILELKFDKWIKDTKENILAVVQESVKDLVEEASTPIKSGGNMPVDTGFLRLSGTGSINQLPEGESEGRNRKSGETGVIYPSNPSGSVSAILPKLKWGDTFYYGWTAIYANVQNIRYGFLDLAVQKWSDIVANNVRRLKE